MIFVGGLSASGKTSLLRQSILSLPGYRHLVASEILKSRGCCLFPQTAEAVEDNQRSLLEALPPLIGESEVIVLDGHFQLEIGAVVHDVPRWFFDGLHLTGIIVIQASVQALKARRVARGDLANASRLEELRIRELSLASEVAGRKNIERFVLHDPDETEVRAALINSAG